MSKSQDSTMSGGNALVSEPTNTIDTPSTTASLEVVSTDTPAVQLSTITDATLPSKANDNHSSAVHDASGASGQSQSPKQTISGQPQIIEGEQEVFKSPAIKEEKDDQAMAIGPAQDEIKAIESNEPDVGPVCNITLLLTSGNRHPYKIDAKYLSRRNVLVPDETESGQPDPYSISIYTLKELILREWRSDWELKPASPSSIRLIHFGKLLDDKEQLKKYRFSTEAPNVIHMSIRPQDLDEEEPKPGSKHLSGGGANGQQRSSGLCCVIL